MNPSQDRRKDGFKGHRNVCWRRFAFEDFLVKIYFVAQISGKKCERFANDNQYRRGPSNDCYVPFPRLDQGASRSWYQARRNCWHFGGDLAPSRAVLNITSSSWPGYGNFCVGLQRDEYLWDNTRGTYVLSSFRLVFRVTATCWLYFLMNENILLPHNIWHRYEQKHIIIGKR